MNRETEKTQRFQECRQRDNCRGRSGFVLLITVVLLVILSTLAYTLTSRVAAQRHRCQYLIDYQTARYACDSGIKYAIAALEDFEIELVDRPNEPDFSDLFAMSEEQYQQYIEQWADQIDFNGYSDINDINGIADSNRTSNNSARTKERASSFDFDDLFGNNSDTADWNDMAFYDEMMDFTDFNNFSNFNDIEAQAELKVRGPYGPQWPLIMESADLEIGSARVMVEIEDENAKYPVTWVMIDDKEVAAGIQAGFRAFCEWMRLGDEDVSEFIVQMEEVNKIKPFKDYLHQPKDMVQSTPAPVVVQTPTPQQEARDSRRARLIQRQAEAAKALAAKQRLIPEATHKQDYIKLMHSSLVDTETLSRPTIISDSRKESALKYMCMWASKKVNINTAPRHVLEAAFAVGGDAEAIAEGIIQARRIKPFENIEELRSSLLSYSDSIKTCEDYITTGSDTFIIRITAVSGAAKASAVIAVLKNGKKVERLAIVIG
jgi:type II secretory pathway component PulK